MFWETFCLLDSPCFSCRRIYQIDLFFFLVDLFYLYIRFISYFISLLTFNPSKLGINKLFSVAFVKTSSRNSYIIYVCFIRLLLNEQFCRFQNVSECTHLRNAYIHLSIFVLCIQLRI